MTSRRSAMWAVAAVVPAPTVGVLAGMYLWPGQAWGMGIYGLCKVWLLLLPLVWHVGVDGEAVKMRRPGGRGLAAGMGVGLATAGVIGLAWWVAQAGWGGLGVERLAAMARASGLDRPGRYLAAAAYFTVVNALLEEYVWRWFVVGRLQRLMPTGWAVAVGSACFTLHHVLALAVQFDATVTVLASVGIFIGAAAWSWLYGRSGSVWPGWVAHAWADAAVFAVGYRLLFGAG